MKSLKFSRFRQLMEKQSEIIKLLEELEDYDVTSLGFSNGYDRVLYDEELASLVTTATVITLREELLTVKKEINEIIGGSQCNNER